ncbi:VWA domain-containing protein [Pseudomonas sp. PDM25]|uniref:VWA domain-containing protein n=1 Tax=Pseudomonas sp. PDM25 TaxID=2854772 RepID=UPI001C43FF38|nr:VWA domain-containing protein [Pseudomonas sp. PDM25]MBV7514470.1 VWA domain-containing protein [Pseudomonas sp. PDM25]
MQKSLNNAFPIIARYYTDDLGVTVVWGGNQPATKNKVLYLPMLTDESQTMILVALGWTAHESAHIKYSDDGVYDKAEAEALFIVRFMNMLEDIRIEKRMMAEHFSTVHPLTVMVKEVIAGGRDFGGQNEATLLMNACLIIGRARLLNQPLQAEAAIIEPEFKKVFGVGRSTKVLGLLSQVADLPDTEAVYQMTHRMLDVLAEDEDQQKPPTQPQQPQSPQNQPQQQSSGEPGPGQDGNDQDQDSQPKSNGFGAGDKGNSKDDPALSGSPASGASDGQNMKKKILSASDDDLKDAISDVASLASDMVATVVDHQTPVPSLVIKDPIGSELQAMRVFKNGQAASMGLRQVMSSLIQGSRNARASLRSSGTKIEGSRLARVRVGENRIFRRQEPVQRTNAAIQLVLDGSTSMAMKIVGPNENLDVLSDAEREAVINARKSALQIAEESAYAILTALEGISGVTTGAMIFPKSHGRENAVGVLKRHSQNLANAFREGRFGQVPCGSTPLSNAMWPAAGDLLKAKGERKVMIVITDGDPDHADSARNMVDRCRASGIEVFAIAFGSANTRKLQDIFGDNHWEFLTDLCQLRNALNNLVQQVLIQAA